ncbi:MAG TPA: C-GCAxxG-C-C family protein [Desulfohalobiaceae bacterium]|nr:C-GCAxxG-C-C family protein [Desulfohalobiaceae bacterium]
MEKKELEELKAKASELAMKYEQEYGGCSQCVLAAIKDTLGGISNEVFKAGTGLAGGIGLTGNSCGALTGGVMALSCYFGRDYEHFPDPEGERFKSFELADKLQAKFEKEYGSSVCKDIQTKIMGRSYDLRIAKEKEEFLEAGGHGDKCPTVCAKAAAYVIDILNEENLI